jgi:hypothetical protein
MAFTIKHSIQNRQVRKRAGELAAEWQYDPSQAAGSDGLWSHYHKQFWHRLVDVLAQEFPDVAVDRLRTQASHVLAVEYGRWKRKRL